MKNQSLINNTPWNWLKKQLAPPVFEDEEKTRIARILGIILWTIVAVVGALIIVWVATGRSDDLGPYAFLANGIIIGVSIGLLFLIRKGHVKTAGLIFVIFLWINISFQAFTSDGVRGSAPSPGAAVDVSAWLSGVVSSRTMSCRTLSGVNFCGIGSLALWCSAQ